MYVDSLKIFLLALKEPEKAEEYYEYNEDEDEDDDEHDDEDEDDDEHNDEHRRYDDHFQRPGLGNGHPTGIGSGHPHFGMMDDRYVRFVY